MLIPALFGAVTLNFGILRHKLIVMNELKAYDQAAQRFYEQKRVKTIPFMAWDIYSEYLHRYMGLSDDIFQLKKLSKKWNESWDFNDALASKNQVIVLTDTNLKIVYSSKNMKAMNGYTAEEVAGASPKMFQGAKTCKTTSLAIRNAVDKGIPFEETILNYRKDGSEYLCHIKGFPIHDKQGKLIHFIAFEKVA